MLLVDTTSTTVTTTTTTTTTHLSEVAHNTLEVRLVGLTRTVDGEESDERSE